MKLVCLNLSFHLFTPLSVRNNNKTHPEEGRGIRGGKVSYAAMFLVLACGKVLKVNICNCYSRA